MSALRGLITGFGTAAIKDKEAKDNARMEVVKAAGLDYYTNQLPQFQKTEKNRAQAYTQLSKILGSEEAADYFDSNGFITGDGKDVERVLKLLEDKEIKPDAFKNYIPTSNYSDRYNTRQSDFETRFDLVTKNFNIQGSGIGPSTVKGLLAQEPGDMTRTETVTTPAVEAEQIPGTPIMTRGTPEKTEEITTTIPRTTADSPMSEFFVSKTGVLNIGKENDIANAASSFRGFGEGMSKDNLGNVTINFMGNKATEYNAFKSVMNDVAQQYETEDGKVSLSLAAQAADEKLTAQTQGIIGLNEVSMVDGYTKGTIKGAESYTATGFSADFENSFEGNTKREKILLYISTLGTKSEAQYFAQSFPSNLTFDDGVNIKQYLLTVTQ
tara:strand:- start:2275 stop:3423 length:1149 start_codon:yes stop_codon:yes gene_type:complete